MTKSQFESNIGAAAPKKLEHICILNLSIPPSIHPATPPPIPLSVPPDELPKRTSLDPTSPSTMSEEEVRASNRDYLRRLDHVKVLQLLDLMDLSKYRNSFIREHVDGEVLVDLREDELKDLGIESKIHILRLSKMINGSTSARKYLEEGNPYGTIR